MNEIEEYPNAKDIEAEKASEAEQRAIAEALEREQEEEAQIRRAIQLAEQREAELKRIADGEAAVKEAAERREREIAQFKAIQAAETRPHKVEHDLSTGEMRIVLLTAEEIVENEASARAAAAELAAEPKVKTTQDLIGLLIAKGILSEDDLKK